MTLVLKGIPTGLSREKMKFNGRHLRLAVKRFGGYAPVRSKVKIKVENISRLVWGDSDRLDARIFGAIKGKTVIQCIYVTAVVGFTGRTKTFRFEILRQAILSRKERTKDVESAINFARQVAAAAGLSETQLENGSIVWSRDPVTTTSSNLIADLDDASSDDSDDSQFADDEPDND